MTLKPIPDDSSYTTVFESLKQSILMEGAVKGLNMEQKLLKKAILKRNYGCLFLDANVTLL